MSSCIKRLSDSSGQATLEAAYLIPVIFLLLLLLLQPSILLYDRMVMKGAAAEGCRLLATVDAGDSRMEEKCVGYVKRRLESVPQQELFHLHESECSWVVSLSGNEKSSSTTVSIENKSRLLPLFAQLTDLVGVTSGGVFTQKVSVSTDSYDSWVSRSETGLDPKKWVERWG